MKYLKESVLSLVNEMLIFLAVMSMHEQLIVRKNLSAFFLACPV